MALVTTSDLEARLGRELSDSEVGRVEALLDDVSNAIVVETGQTFELVESTIRLKIKYGVVRLPQRPVVSITSVEDANGTPVSYEWDTRDRLDVRTSGWLNAFEMNGYRIAPRYVDVTYEHGYDPIPGAIVGVACSIALRTLGQDPTDGAVVEESIDAYRYRIGSTGAAGAFGVLPDEWAILNRYRRAGGSMALALP